MKTGKSKAAAILLVIATLFLIYGIYAVFNAVQYVTTYTTASTITTMGSIHYIVTSSMAYFGFASMLIAASLILMNINRVSAQAADQVKAESAAAPVNVKPAAAAPVNVEPASDDSVNVEPAAEPEEGKSDHDTERPAAVEPVTEPITDSSAVNEVSKQEHDDIMPAVPGELKHREPEEEPDEMSFKYTDTVPLPAILTSEINRDFRITAELLKDIFE